MSLPEDAQGPGDDPLVEGELEFPDHPGGSQRDVSAPAQATGRPLTGDDAVDEALGQLDQVDGEPLDTQIEVGERVHRVLQGRLADLGKE